MAVNTYTPFSELVLCPVNNTLSYVLSTTSSNNVGDGVVILTELVAAALTSITGVAVCPDWRIMMI